MAVLHVCNSLMQGQSTSYVDQFAQKISLFSAPFDQKPACVPVDYVHLALHFSQHMYM